MCQPGFSWDTHPFGSEAPQLFILWENHCHVKVCKKTKALVHQTVLTPKTTTYGERLHCNNFNYSFTKEHCYLHDGQRGQGRPLPPHTRWWRPGSAGWQHRSCCPGRCVWSERHHSSSLWWRPYRTRDETWSCGTGDAMSSEIERERQRSVKDSHLCCFSIHIDIALP